MAALPNLRLSRSKSSTNLLIEGNNLPKDIRQDLNCLSKHHHHRIPTTPQTVTVTHQIMFSSGMTIATHRGIHERSPPQTSALLTSADVPHRTLSMTFLANTHTPDTLSPVATIHTHTLKAFQSDGIAHSNATTHRTSENARPAFFFAPSRPASAPATPAHMCAKSAPV